MEEITVNALRKELRQAGFKLTLNRYSDFIGGSITNKDGLKLGSIMTRTDYESFKPAIDIREKYKGKLFDGSVRIVL